MRILGIDPGPKTSGVVIYSADAKRLLYANDAEDNKVLYKMLRFPHRDLNESILHNWDSVAIEDIIPRGHAVGKTTFDTLRWVERFRTLCEIFDHPVQVVSRGDVMIVLCGARTFIDETSGQRQGIKDTNLRQVIIDSVPHTGDGAKPWIGTKKHPGPLFGIKGHCWSALAVAFTVINT